MEITDLVGELPRNPKRKPNIRSHNKIQWIAVHHLGTGQSKNFATPYSVTKYHIGPNHISKKGCPTVCYHLMISKTGKVYKTENYSTITWQVNSVYNRSTIGILLLDDLDKNVPTTPMIESLLRVIGEELYNRFPQLSYVRIRGHREFPFVRKSCPGKNVDMRAIRSMLKELHG